MNVSNYQMKNTMIDKSWVFILQNYFCELSSEFSWTLLGFMCMFLLNDLFMTHNQFKNIF